MRGLGLAKAIMMCGIAAAMNEKMYSRHHEREPDGKKHIKPDTIPKGQRYVFPDGFECYALNKKNADRKHKNWKT